MKLQKAAETLIIILFTAFILWILASWADVLLHQFEGEPHAWNAFRIFVQNYYAK